MATAADFAAAMDQASIDQAAQLANLTTTDRAAAFFAALHGPDSPAAANPLAAHFGLSTAVIGDLLAIIGRDRAELARLRAANEELRDRNAELSDMLDRYQEGIGA